MKEFSEKNKTDIKIIAEGLAYVFKDDPKKITYWLLTPNPYFGPVAPSDLIFMRGNSGLRKVAQFIHASLEENGRAK